MGSMGSEGPNVSSGGQRRLLSDWADAQADLSLCWAHRIFFFLVNVLLVQFGLILHALISVLFLFFLVSGIGCGLWFWHSPDFSMNFVASV